MTAKLICVDANFVVKLIINPLETSPYLLEFRLRHGK